MDVLRLILTACMLAAPAAATLAAPADPTRPAAGFAGAADAPRNGGNAGIGSTGARGNAAGKVEVSPAVVVPLPVVQSIHLPQVGPPSALVDNRLVHPGERIGDWTLVAIDPDGLLLRGPTGPQRLWLLDGVRRAPASAETRIAAVPPPTPNLRPIAAPSAAISATTGRPAAAGTTDATPTLAVAGGTR